MLSVIDQLLSDNACFLVITNGNEWVETTLILRGHMPSLAAGQTAQMISWSGKYDSVIKA